MKRKAKKSSFPEDLIVRDHIGIVDVDRTLDRMTLANRAKLQKIVEEEKFDLSDKEIKELCLSVFYARPSVGFMALNPMIMMAMQQIEVPARRFNVILDKFVNWIKQDAASKRGSFRMDGSNVVIRSRVSKR